MASIGGYYTIDPVDWNFGTHGDVVEGKRRANELKKSSGTFEGAEYQIKEFVRQWALAQLLKEYKYPADWIGERIVIEESVKMGSTEKQADISIKNGNNRTFLYIEVKKGVFHLMSSRRRSGN